MDLKTLFPGSFFALNYAVLAALIMWPASHMMPASPKIFTAVFAAIIFLILVGIHDLFQIRYALLHNYPIIGHLRFFFEKIRPEMRQYFFEGDTDGRPFPRERRATVYRRAKPELDKKPFGTQRDVYAEGHEWMLHSIKPAPLTKKLFCLNSDGPPCTKAYDASVLNISAMDYGAHC